MKFLLFNAAVIAALVYLFGVDRSDLDAASDHLQTSADRLGEVARDKVDAALDELDKTPARPDSPVRTSTEAPAAPAKAAEAPEAVSEDTDQRSLGPAVAPEVDAAAKPEAVASAPPNHASPDTEGPEGSAAEPLPAVRDPAVAKRRAEVLGGVASADGRASVALAEGEQLMSPEQRVRELHALAEEMELLFVDKMAR